MLEKNIQDMLISNGRAFMRGYREEFTVYAMPVGTVRSCDKAAEQSFYRFVEEEGL